MYKRGMVFGVFDALHEGHKHFLASAAEQCEELVVAVAPDKIVESLKGKKPRQALQERMQALSSLNSAFRVVSGDSELNSWVVLRREQPDIVFLGYDQKGLEAGITALNVPSVVLASYEPIRYKSSLINGSAPPNLG